MPQGRLGALSTSTWAAVEEMTRAARLGVRCRTTRSPPSGSTVSSLIVFHSLQAGQRPNHPDWAAPQEEQTQRERGFLDLLLDLLVAISGVFGRR